MKNTYRLSSFVIFPLILLQVLSGFAVWANDDKIKQLDLDQDGKIAIKEAVADPELLASFGKIDTDGDGLITRLELERAKYVAQKLKVQTTTNE